MTSADCISTISSPFSQKDVSDCYLKGCKWSPDGLCILTASGDRKIRLFEVDVACSSKNQDPVITYNEGGTIYDYAWYPAMSSRDPVSCVFASCSKDAPVHLWDAFTGALRATYQPINQFDEVHPAYSLCFSFDSKIYCGFKKEIKIFDLGLPGRVSEVRSVKEYDQGNIISAIAVNPALPSVYALGCYDKSVGIYTEPNGELLYLMKAHKGGVTQVSFSPNGHFLFSGARMDNKLLCWDLRMPGKILFTVLRAVNTSQRIHFDLMAEGQYLLTGSTDGTVSVYSTSQAPQESGILDRMLSWQAHNDCANGVSVHPKEKVLATASGQRHLRMDFSDDEGDIPDEIVENNLKIWKLSLSDDSS